MSYCHAKYRVPWVIYNCMGEGHSVWRIMYCIPGVCSGFMTLQITPQCPESWCCLALFPDSSQAFCCILCTVCDTKLGRSLGTRLGGAILVSVTYQYSLL